MNDHSDQNSNDIKLLIYSLIDHLIKTGVIDEDEFQQSYANWLHKVPEGTNLPVPDFINPPAPSTPPRPSPDACKNCIMLVDDVKFVRDLIKNSLSAYGYTNIIEAENGYTAVELFEERQPGLVLMDIEMKGQDGIDTYEQLKAINDKTPVIFMTGNAQEDYVKRASKLGVAEFLAKPLDINRLIKVVEDHISKQ